MTQQPQKRVAFYLRVSTGEQSTEMQKTELEAVAAPAGRSPRSTKTPASAASRVVTSVRRSTVC